MTYFMDTPISPQVREEDQDCAVQVVGQAVQQGSHADHHVRRHRAESRVLHNSR